jgi:Na+/H+-translocating membrane pyrophosphatase
MMTNRIFRTVCLSVGVALLCAVAQIVGAIISLAAGIIGLSVLSRRESAGASFASEFSQWILCTVTFAVTTLLLSPLTNLLAISVAYCILSPLFGTMIMVIDRALGSAVSHAD